VKSFLYNALLPAVISAIVIVQLYHVKTQALTPWKGGGFGMYAGPHWSLREVWFFGLPEGVHPLAGFDIESRHVRQFPSEENILVLARKVKEKYNTASFTVEVWEPVMGEEGALKRVMLKRVYVP